MSDKVIKVIKIDPEFKGRGGLAGSFTWQRLESILRATGELRDNEGIEGYVVSNGDVKYYIKKLDKD